MRQKLEFLSPYRELVRHAGEKQAARRGLLQGNPRERNLQMAKFLFVYRRGSAAADKMTPEEMQQLMQKWHTWISEGLQKGWILDPGDALTQEGRVVNAKKVVTDGPFVESKEIVGGFSIVQAEAIDAAAELAKGCPALLTGGSVEVRCLAGFSVKK